jgi:thiol-disulfide isomerase/thioredoxin
LVARKSCGFCRDELPHLEKLYEQPKQRSDIQIIAFDVDEELGLVAPFLAEKDYTFPVSRGLGLGQWNVCRPKPRSSAELDYDFRAYAAGEPGGFLRSS